MREYENLDRSALLLVFLCLVCVFAAQVYACRGIVLDGANFFLDILQSRSFPWWDWHRVVHHVATEFPTVLAVKLGVRNLVFLRYLFSAWPSFCILFIWGGTFWNLRRDVLLWPFVLLFCFLYFNSSFMVLAEYNFCFALTAFCLAVLLRPMTGAGFERFSLLLAATLLPFEYAATLFLGSFLLLLVLRKPEAEWNGASRAYRMALVFFFALSIVSAIWEIISPRDLNNLNAAMSFEDLLGDVQYWCMLAYIITAPALVFATQAWLRVGLASACVGLLVVAMLYPNNNDPIQGYLVRAYTSATMAFLCAGLWWFQNRGQKLLQKNGSAWKPVLAILALILLSTFSAFDIRLSIDYANFLKNFRDTINRQTGIVSFEESGMAFVPDIGRFTGVWAYPLMSVVLRDDERKAIVLNPAQYHGYQSFDSLQNVPDLNRYYH